MSSLLCHVMLTEHCGHSSTVPQSGHSKILEYPRLFRNKIACSPFSSRWASLPIKMFEIAVPAFSRFISTMKTVGIFRPSILFAILESPYLPVLTLLRVSSAGVAEPSRQAQLQSFARNTAMSRPL